MLMSFSFRGVVSKTLLTRPSNRQIIDDEYNHSLVVFEDLATKGIRLHVAVGGGEMRHCPVWTAFSKQALRYTLHYTVLLSSV